jgi:uncharacterized damage-inducible protein DinB
VTSDRKALERMVAYDRWANGEALASLERMPSPPPDGVRLLAHVVGAQAGWLRRLGVPNDFAGPWAEADLAALREAWSTALPALWEALWRDPGASDPAREVSYRTTKGEAFRSTVADILTHVVIHGAHHRGQIARCVREGSGAPASTDFILAARTGAVA